MSVIINILDNMPQRQFGENGHAEYKYSNNLQEKILQFHFQLTRTDDTNELQSVLHNILLSLKNMSSSIEKKEYLCMLYKMIGQTRDIISGKGEYNLTYMMIYTWYLHYPNLALFALKCLVSLENKTEHPYGSWKDTKYFCKYCKDKGLELNHPLILYSIHLINSQIKKDYEILHFIDSYSDSYLDSYSISLAAKWVPREKSSFSWIYEKLCIHYFSEYIITANSLDSYNKALLKCKTNYRKIISALNKKLDTLQIKQCDKNWQHINFNNVTSISLSKQKKAFLNINKKGVTKYSNNEDRQLCATNFTNFIKSSLNEDKTIKGKCVGMESFTKQAIELIKDSHTQNNKLEIDLLNSQWKNNSLQTGSLSKMIAMVDVSGSMEGDPLYAAIALGIRVAEKSILGKRVLTFSERPNWINLENCSDFVSMVQQIYTADWGTNTNFYSALKLILNAIVENKMDPADVKDMILVVFSDMQIDCASDEFSSYNNKSYNNKSHNNKKNNITFYDRIKEEYANAGINAIGEAYEPPHILFWNLRSTSGFPNLSTQQNTSMMSGFSPSLLNLFCDSGIEALQSYTPWINLKRSLDNTRYKYLEDKLVSTIFF